MESEKERCIRFKDLKAEPDHMLHAKSCQTYTLTKASPYTSVYRAYTKKRTTPYSSVCCANTNQKDSVYQAVCREHNTYTKKTAPYTNRIPKGTIPVYQPYIERKTSRIPSVHQLVCSLSYYFLSIFHTFHHQ